MSEHVRFLNVDLEEAMSDPSRGDEARYLINTSNVNSMEIYSVIANCKKSYEIVTKLKLENLMILSVITMSSFS